MTEEELVRIRPHFVSMGMMLESVKDDSECSPEKKVAGRRAGIEAAGRAKVPFTSGILVGLGEDQASRLESLEMLAELHSQHGHLQEILIQRYVPNAGSSWPEGVGPTLGEYSKMIDAWRMWAPEVAIQIPPNLEPRWRDLVNDLDDLGGISWARDEVNPSHPWKQVEHYKKECAIRGRDLVERLPVYKSHSTEEWLSRPWMTRVSDFWKEVPK
jgi:7,8-didemethyl-8-hydroxy-5-deazariboflavin synthase CofG subunit